MQTDRPIVLSVAGFDPCGGAGVLADSKTFEQLGAQGMAVITANTIQSEDTFVSAIWEDIEAVTQGIHTLMQRYSITVVKIGIVKDFWFLKAIVDAVREENEQAFVIWDPVIRASAGFSFFKEEDVALLGHMFSAIDLLTPNVDEYQKIQPFLPKVQAVLLKGGHSEARRGWDILYTATQEMAFPPMGEVHYAKHGSGCVLSSAIAAYIALGEDLPSACRLGKIYVERFLNSHPSLLGYHNHHD